MTATVPDLSVIILTWRDQHFLPACLQSIRASLGDWTCEVIVVENGGTTSRRDAESPELRVIHNDRNRGVAAARNQGLRAARGRYLMLLDVDTRALGRALDHLVRFMELNGEVGLAGPRFFDSRGRLQFTCRRLPTVWSKVLRRIPLRWAREQLADEMLAGWDHATVREVDYCIGACQIIRRQAFERVGFLDEHIFYGPEDIDYCIRMWQHRWHVAYVPQATFIHYEQRVTKRQPFSHITFAHLRGLAFYFWKHRYLSRAPNLRALDVNGITVQVEERAST